MHYQYLTDALQSVCLYREDMVSPLTRIFVEELMEGKKEGRRKGREEGRKQMSGL